MEPASAASVAGVLKLQRKGYFKDTRGTLVCTLTGHGLKDPNIAIQNIKKPLRIKAELKAILKHIGY